MGNAKSTCRVVNEARYEIVVEVYSPKDFGGEFAKQRFTILPGLDRAIPATKKGLQLRISGNGRVQDIMRAAPGETILVRKVQRGLSQQGDETSLPDPEAPVSKPQAVETAERKQQVATDKKRVREWLDDKDKYSKDELEQLMLKLKSEGRADQRKKIMKQIKAKEASAQKQKEPEDKDELSASIAALQRRNDKRGFSRATWEDSGAVKHDDDSEGSSAGNGQEQFTVNTDSKTDDLMAAINRLTTGSPNAHQKKSSWDRMPNFVAHV